MARGASRLARILLGGIFAVAGHSIDLLILPVLAAALARGVKARGFSPAP